MSLTFAQTVHRARLRNAVTWQALADACGATPAKVCDWERAQEIPSDDAVVRKMAARLGLDSDELVRLAHRQPLQGDTLVAHLYSPRAVIDDTAESIHGTLEREMR